MSEQHFDLTYLNLGAGVQSSALLVCSALGLHGVPKADVAIFADTGDEPQYVYDYVALLGEWAGERGVPVETVSRGVLSRTMIEQQANGGRFVTPPLFVALKGGSEGMLMRQCTVEFKVDPIERRVRELLGLAPRQRAKHVMARALLGISIDEALRMKPARRTWIHNCFPLVDAGLTRRDCERIVVDAGLPMPKKSACVFCPYHSDAFWENMKANEPLEFARAVAFDKAIRSPIGGRTQEAFVHRSLKPLDEVDFNPMRDQVDMFGNECEGMCGV